MKNLDRLATKLACLLILLVSLSCNKEIDFSRVVTNPIDVDYAFTREHSEGGREAADPVVVLFGDRYYMFASKSYGYWSSEDMHHWTFITNNLLPFDLYAPAVMSYKNELYFMASFQNRLYKTSSPEDGDSWVVASDSICAYRDDPSRIIIDPYLFVDDDDRVYLYWGCSQVEPIQGVELDTENGFRAKDNPVELIPHNEKIYGWECRGDKNDTSDPSSNEGSAMFKYNGRYYLQYAGPGTEFDCYGDGLYVGDSPLGPFTHYENSPFSIKPGGWMTGAGHGDTFQDKYGNWWHVSSTVVCQRFLFERRIGFYPVIFTEEGFIHALTDFSDYPYILPNRKMDWKKESPWTGWMDLSLGKTATASSQEENHPASFATDNTIKTWWSATSGEPKEWIAVDLEQTCRIHAVQTNFADEDFGMYETNRPKSPYKYRVEASDDGSNWRMICDMSNNTTTRPHELIVLPKPVKARHIRLTNTGQLTGKFSVHDLRVFGIAPGKKPDSVKEISIARNSDKRRIEVSWPAADRAQGYVLHWGTRPDELFSTCQAMGTSLELGLFSNNQDYYFRVDAFNGSGITQGTAIASTSHPSEN